MVLNENVRFETEFVSEVFSFSGFSFVVAGIVPSCVGIMNRG